MISSTDLEGTIVEKVLAKSRGDDAFAWRAFADCRAVEVYTDGSAPVQNPGGQAGFAAIVVGFVKIVDAGTPARPEPLARLDLGGYVPARAAEPRTSNNRVEIAGILAGLTALIWIAAENKNLETAVIWSDSLYAIQCGTGVWKRQKNLDLWKEYDKLEAGLMAVLGRHWRLAKVKGHSGALYNEAADVLASRAAFNWDDDALSRYRQAQQASGREMPTADALAQVGLTQDMGAGAGTASGEPSAEATSWTVLLSSSITAAPGTNGVSGAARGSYLLDGPTVAGTTTSIRHSGQRAIDEAEYLTLIAALRDLDVLRSLRSGGESAPPVVVHSRRELVVKQLRGEYKVRSAPLIPLYQETRALLQRLGPVSFVWDRSPALEQKIKSASVD